VAVKSYGSSKASITKTANGFNTATNSHNTAAERERVVLPPKRDNHAPRHDSDRTGQAPNACPLPTPRFQCFAARAFATRGSHPGAPLVRLLGLLEISCRRRRPQRGVPSRRCEDPFRRSCRQHRSKDSCRRRAERRHAGTCERSAWGSEGGHCGGPPSGENGVRKEVASFPFHPCCLSHRQAPTFVNPLLG
jgi:hypothetical protein